MNDPDRRVTVRWNDAGFGEPVVGGAVARPGYGGIVLGPHASLRFEPSRFPAGNPPLGRLGPLAMPSRRRRHLLPRWQQRLSQGICT